MFKTILKLLLLILNILAVFGMIVCSYSVYLSPATFPNWSYLGMIIPAFIVATIIFLLIWIMWKWKYCLISIMGILICWNSIRDYCPINFFQGNPSGKTIKLLSYNVLYFGDQDEDGENNKIVDYIINSNADIVCIQEGSNIKRVAIFNKLNEVYPYIVVDNDNTPNVSVLSKYPILKTEHIAFETNSASSYCYDIKVDEDTIRVVNNHLESYQLNDKDKEMYKKIVKSSYQIKEDIEGNDTTNKEQGFLMLEDKLVKANSLRATQADILKEKIDSFTNKYIIVCGDFNDTPISYVHKQLTEKLHDAYTQSGFGPGWSYNRSGMYFRIDHILISDSFQSFGAKVDDSLKESDHYPIFCTLELQ